MNITKTVQSVPTSPIICASTTLGNLKRQTELSMQYLHVHFNESVISYKKTGSYVSKIIKRVVSNTNFTSYARNVCLQHERMYVDAGATSPTAPSMNCVIQTVHSFSLRRHRSSKFEILVRAGGGRFEHVI